MEIRVDLEDISTVEKKLKVVVPAEDTSREFERIARDFKKQARLPGFRPGKAPLGLIKRRFSNDIRTEVIQSLLPESYEQAVREKAVKPLGQPELENIECEEGKPLTYEAKIEITPEIKLPDYRGLRVEVPAQVATDKEVEERLEALREENATLQAVEDRPVAEGDFVTIDLKGEYVLAEEGHGHQHDPINEEDVQVHVGDEQTHSAFNENLPGMNIGEEKTFEVEYEKDYPEKRLAGHRVRFRVEVTDIKRQVLPELNDEFARDLGEHDSLESLKEELRAELEARITRQKEELTRQKVVQKLTDLVPFEVPKVLIEERLDKRLRDLAYNMAYQGVDPSRAKINWQKVREEIRPEAEQDVRAGLILGEVARQEGIDVSTEEIEEEIARMVKNTEQPEEKIRQYLLQNGRMEGLKSELLRRKALDLIMEHARIETANTDINESIDPER